MAKLLLGGNLGPHPPFRPECRRRDQGKTHLTLPEKLLRIVHAVLDLHEGGLERIVTELVRHASLAGHDARVVCLQRAGQLADELDPGQVSVVRDQGRFSMLVPSALSRLMRDLRPDVLHLHSGVWFKAAYASRLAGSWPVVFTDHGRPHPDTLAHRLPDMLGARITDRVVAVSTPLAEYLVRRLHVPSARVTVVQNGIMLSAPPSAEEVRRARAEVGIHPDATVIGSVGRLDPVKAYHRLLTAFSSIRVAREASRGPVVLLLAGDGPERGRLERLSVELGLGEAVRFLGWRSDVSRVLACMDLFVLPSDSEGTSLSLLEAMAAGIPVVATAVGGTPDVFGGAVVGRLVAPGDTDALATAIACLVDDAELRQACGRRGRERVVNSYSFDAMARAYQALYVELTGGRSASAGGRVDPANS